MTLDQIARDRRELARLLDSGTPAEIADRATLIAQRALTATEALLRAVTDNSAKTAK